MPWPTGRIQASFWKEAIEEDTQIRGGGGALKSFKRAG